MKSLRVVLAAVLLAGVTGCGSSSHPSKNTLIVINKRLGPFRIGEPRQKVESVTGPGRVVAQRKPGPNDYFGSLTKDYPDAAIRAGYITKGGRAGLFSVETTSSSYRTQSGIGVGSTVEQVKKLGDAYCDSPSSCDIQSSDASMSTFFVFDKTGTVIRVGISGLFG